MTEPPTLVLTGHGSADPRSGSVTRDVAAQIRLLRPELDVRVAFCELSTPNLREVLVGLSRPAVVTPLLLASAFHARVDIPAMIAEAKVDVLQADTLGEDPRLITVLGQRLAQAHTGRHDIGVLVVAVGSTDAAANARTATIADELPGGPWSAVRVAFATGPEPSVSDGIENLRAHGARRIVLAPWFIAPGRITDRVAEIATAAKAVMAEPLGAHPLVAATALDRFDRAVSQRRAA